MNTAVFERRHVIGGAAVTEEIVPGEPKRWVRGMGVTTGDPCDCLHPIHLQGLSSPEHPTSSACYDRRFTPNWS